MKVLIIHAHPESRSFSSALKDAASDYFSGNSDEVKVSDLYEMDFNPVAGRGDFKKLDNPDFFKYQLEQKNAVVNDLFEDKLKKETEKFLWADLVIFNFPLWWFSMPAIMKGWVDKVFAMGFAYGAGKGVYETGAYKDKKAFCCITTGGPETAYGPGGRNGSLDTILYHINHGMLYFVGMQTLPPFIIFSPARKSEEERTSDIEKYKSYLLNINSHKPLY